MNKIIVSIVFAIILVLGINKVADVIFHVEKPEKSAYQVAGVTTAASTTVNNGSSENAEQGNIMALFASTNAAEHWQVSCDRSSSCSKPDFYIWRNLQKAH